jgi:uncharacterized protein involved in exopolysaccharide biosynthesis
MRENQVGVVEIVSALFRHKKLFSSLFFGIVGIAVLYSLLAHKQYASEMKIVILNARSAEVVTASNAVTPVTTESTDLTEARINSEVELLTDSDLMEQLVNFRGGLVPDEPAPAHGSKAMGLAIRRITGAFEILPVKKSNVVTITYTDISPGVAQKVLQELTKIYLEKHVRFTRPASTSSFFNAEAAQSVTRLQDVEGQLVEFRRKNEFVDLDKEKAAVDLNLNTIKQSILTDSAQLEATTSQISQLESSLNKTDKRVLTSVTTMPNQQGIQTLIATLTDLKNKRIALIARYRPTDRLVVELDNQIANSQRSLDELRHDQSQTSTDVNPTATLLTQQLEALQVQRSGLQKSLAILRGQASTYQQKLDHLLQITETSNNLERQVSEMSGMNQSITAKRDASLVEDMLDQGQFGNVAVAQPPSFSMLHTKPKLVLNTILGFVTATFLCGALLFILESRRSTILTSADLRLLSDIPVLASIPEKPAYKILTQPGFSLTTT